MIAGWGLTWDFFFSPFIYDCRYIWLRGAVAAENCFSILSIVNLSLLVIIHFDLTCSWDRKGKTREGAPEHRLFGDNCADLPCGWRCLYGLIPGSSLTSVESAFRQCIQAVRKWTGGTWLDTLSHGIDEALLDNYFLHRDTRPSTLSTWHVRCAMQNTVGLMSGYDGMSLQNIRFYFSTPRYVDTGPANLSLILIVRDYRCSGKCTWL